MTLDGGANLSAPLDGGDQRSARLGAQQWSRPQSSTAVTSTVVTGATLDSPARQSTEKRTSMLGSGDQRSAGRSDPTRAR
jgi:hypothetical protein